MNLQPDPRGFPQSPSATLVPLRVHFEPRVPDDQLLAQARSAIALPLPRLAEVPPHGDTLVIAGGGPSLAGNIAEIGRLVRGRAKLLAVNEVSHFLASHGIEPWAAIHLGPVELTTGCIGRPQPALHYYLASICPPSAFARLAAAGAPTTLWHPFTGTPGVDELLARAGGPVIAGGFSCGLRAIGLGRCLGFRRFEIFGLDSSSDRIELHSYSSVSDGVEEYRGLVQFDGGWFDTTPELVGQAQDFVQIYRDIADAGGTITVHGRGLLPQIVGYLKSGKVPPPILLPGVGAEAVAQALKF